MTKPAERIADTAAVLTASALGRRMNLSGDGRVSAKDAATLTGVSLTTLKRLRASGTGPQWRPIPIGGSRISYRIVDLAMWIEEAGS